MIFLFAFKYPDCFAITHLNFVHVHVCIKNTKWLQVVFLHVTSKIDDVQSKKSNIFKELLFYLNSFILQLNLFFFSVSLKKGNYKIFSFCSDFKEPLRISSCCEGMCIHFFSSLNTIHFLLIFFLIYMSFKCENYYRNILVHSHCLICNEYGIKLQYQFPFTCL